MTDPFVGIDFGTTNTVARAGRQRRDRAARRLPRPRRRRDHDLAHGAVLRARWRRCTPARPAIDALRRDRGRGAPGAVDQIAPGERGVHAHDDLRQELDARGAGRRSSCAACARRAGVSGARAAVVGRPVRYWGAGTEADDARAVARMRAALAAAGFGEVVFEFEPIAAALRYAARLDHDELVLVADFGGGTSDFSLVRVGPQVAPGDARAILGTGGLGGRRRRVRRAHHRCGGRAGARPRHQLSRRVRRGHRRCRPGCSRACGAGTTCRS